MKTHRTRQINVGNVSIGGKSPVAIQSMAKTDTRDVDSTVRQIILLEKAGCEIVRVAVKDVETAEAIRQIKKSINIPLVADIHFDYRLALKAIEAGADKIRINPGNINRSEQVNAVIDSAAEKNIPVRVGINSGSLVNMAEKASTPYGIMVESLFKYLEYFEKRKFTNIVLSLKSSDVRTTVRAYEEISRRCDYPLHVGITAAGSYNSSVVKSSIGIGALLLQGIGDTIRVSLTGDPVREIDVAIRILSSIGVRSFGPEIISCPTCGRCQVDLLAIVQELENEFRRDSALNFAGQKKGLVVAVMGCEVNGPGEASNADIGIAFGKDRGAIFKKGKIVKTVNYENAVKALLELIKE
jgi:(E)-4-hydroxy-3-methylbut-2-enyl-diphosphate synthase